MDDLQDGLARLDARLESLERRLAALERLSQSAMPAAAPGSRAVPAHPASGSFALASAGGLFPVAGKAMLGIAGAYVLRAVAESGSVSKIAVAVLALVYAGTWLVWAARREGTRLVRGAYSATAALILAPMLAELSLRFGVLTAPTTAALLSAFAIVALALSWKGDSSVVVWVAVLSAVVTAFALLIASHDLVPYTMALLVAAVVAESGAGRYRLPALRWIVAAAADMAVLILIYIYSLPDTSRSNYAAVSQTALLAVPSLLFLAYGTVVAVRTFLLRHRISLFEMAQAVTAFLLGALCWLWLGSSAARLELGVFCWLLGAICYAAAFLYFDRDAEQRNYHVYSTWSLGLVLTGSVLVLPPLPLALGLSAASIVAVLVGVRMERLTPEFHGLVYLAAAALVSGLLEYGGRALAGTFPAAPGWPVWIVAVSALLCYAIGGRFEGDRWNHRLLRLVAAVLAVSAAATFLVSLLVWFAALGMTPSESHVAVIRTLITCTVALALAFGGSRWQRVELVWTAYGTLALVTVKLLFEDLAQGHSGSIALSIFLYAAALIMVPRVARTGQKRA